MMTLIPLDEARCQAMRPTSASFMVLGGKSVLIRCNTVPVVIAEEVEPGDDGKQGSMSLCLHCLCVLSKQERELWMNMKIREIETNGPER